jgi:hypothetical protein
MSRQWVLLLLFARGPPSTELCRVAGQGISQKQQNRPRHLRAAGLLSLNEPERGIGNG